VFDLGLPSPVLVLAIVVTVLALLVTVVLICVPRQTRYGSRDVNLTDLDVFDRRKVA
jgi:hypothetical protein